MKTIRLQICAVLVAFALAGVPASGTSWAADAPSTNPVGTVGIGNTTITIATTVPTGTAAPQVAAPPVVSIFDQVLAFLGTPAVGIAIAGVLGALLLTVNGKTTATTIAARQAVVDEVTQWEGMVTHAANVVKSNPQLDALPYADKAASFIQAFNVIYQNTVGRAASQTDGHDAVATAAQIGVLAPAATATVKAS